MSLGQKTLLIVLLTGVGLMAVLYATARVVILRGFLNLEQTQTRSAVERAGNALNDDIASLAATANDYGEWDRTYAFMQHPSQGYIRQELENDTLQGLSINSVLLMDLAGNVVFYKSYDFLRKRENEDPMGARLTLASDPWVRLAETSSTPASVILLLPQGPVLIAASPILTTERKGPVQGVLVMTRDLDQARVDRLKAVTRSAVSIELVSNAGLAPDLQAARSPFEVNHQAITVQPLSKAVVTGHTLLKDVRARPALRLRVDLPRAVFQQGLTSLSYFLGSLCVVSLAFGFVIMLLLRHTILARLTHLNSEVSRIGKCRDLSQRVGFVGNDELSKLGTAVNIMLEALQKGDSQFRQIADQIHQLFWVKDESTQEIAYISPPWESSWGLTRENVYAGSKSWLEAVHPDDRGVVADMLERQRRGQKGQIEYRIVLPEGGIRWIWVRHFPVFTAARQLTQTVGLAEDITEQKRSEELLSESHKELWNVMATIAKQPSQ